MTPREPPPHARARQIAAELAQIGFALPGSIVRRNTACGKTGCHCQADPPVLHGPYLSWIRKIDGKPVTRNLTPEQGQRYRPWFDNTRRLHQLIGELHAMSVQAIEDAEAWPTRKKP